LTAFIDASNVYGSTIEHSKLLRTFSLGRMKVTLNDMAPFEEGNVHAVLTGDERGRENPMLTTIHMIFLREHNRLADQIRRLLPAASDETWFQVKHSLN